MGNEDKNNGFLPEEEKAEKVKKLLNKSKAAALGLAVMLTLSTGLSGCSNKYNNEEDEDDSYYTGGRYYGGYFYSSGGSYRSGSWSDSSSSKISSGTKGYSGSSKSIGG